jgi:hypothetical protein
MMTARHVSATVGATVLTFLLAAPVTAQQIPAGTAIAVRTSEAIDSQNADLTREYAAGLDDDLVVNGVTLAPRGARATLRVIEARKAGAVKGRASLTLALVALTINGKVVAVESGEVQSESASQGKKATKFGAIGGAAGGIVGGVLGGAKGAAAGAAAGAGAGVGVAALNGQRVQVPSETRLTFTLANPASVP